MAGDVLPWIALKQEEKKTKQNPKTFHTQVSNIVQSIRETRIKTNDAHTKVPFKTLHNPAVRPDEDGVRFLARFLFLVTAASRSLIGDELE